MANIFPNSARCSIRTDTAKQGCNRIGVSQCAKKRLNAGCSERREKILEIQTQHHMSSNVRNCESLDGSSFDKSMCRSVCGYLVQNFRQNFFLNRLEP